MLPKQNIYLNSDVGEGSGKDALLMPYLSACSIACGGHYGDRSSMENTVQLAMQHGVKIGGHPSYPDPKNFGRKKMNISERVLTDSIHEQLSNITEVLRLNKAKLHHIKAHGALYNEIAQNEKEALVYLNAAKQYKNICSLMVPSQSLIQQLAIEQGFKTISEAFTDRNYTKDLNLVSRSQANAIIHQPEEALQHVLEIIEQEHVTTVSGEKISLNAETFCIHSDHKQAVAIAKHLYTHLHQKGFLN